MINQNETILVYHITRQLSRQLGNNKGRTSSQSIDGFGNFVLESREELEEKNTKMEKHAGDVEFRGI